LAAIAVVIVLVSLPRLRSFALRENESDAVYLLRVVGENLRAGTVEAADAAPPNLVELLRNDADLERRLQDCHDLGEGRVVRHGYLFEAYEPEPGCWALRAWPYRHGQTGRRAFAWFPDIGLRVHLNRGARFDGPDVPPGEPASSSGGASWHGAAKQENGWREARR
jgi:hypothetical protein